jgi:hypothetical protein
MVANTPKAPYTSKTNHSIIRNNNSILVDKRMGVGVKDSFNMRVSRAAVGGRRPWRMIRTSPLTQHPCTITPSCTALEMEAGVAAALLAIRPERQYL